MALTLTKGNIWQSIWKMSWPMVVIMLGNFALGIVDIYVAGRLGSEVQASVGFCMQILFLLSIIANAAGMGSLSLISRSVGGGDRERTIEIARQAILYGILMAFLIVGLILIFSRQIVALAGFPQEIRELSISLLRIYGIALASSYVVIIANAIYRASGEPLKSLFIMVSMNLMNIALIFPLVFGVGGLDGLGASGLAIAMALSTIYGVGVSLLCFRGKGWDGFYRGRLRFSRQDIASIVSIGWPTALMQIAWHSGTLALMGILGGLEGSGITGIAAMTNGLRIEAIIYLPAFALNMSASVLTGQNLGAGNVERAERTAWMIVAVGIIIVSVLSIIICLSAPFIANQVSMDYAVQQETIVYLYFNMPIEPLMALGVILSGAMQGAGDTRGVMKIIVISMWLIRLPLAWFLAVYVGWGSKGVWTAMIVSMALQGILMAKRFKGGKWKN